MLLEPYIQIQMRLPKKRKVLVIAGNVQEWGNFCDEKLMEFDNDDSWNGEIYEYYQNLLSVKGKSYEDYICYGTGTMRKDVDWSYIKICLERGGYKLFEW